MNKKRLVYVIGSGNQCYGYSNWLEKTGLTNDIEKADLCLGVGGSDVCSKYYNQPDSGRLSVSERTDAIEYEDYSQAIKLGKKIVGTCKSLQWGAALAGGAIFQDIRHPSYHKVRTFDGQYLFMNSLHHNMADLSKLKENKDYKLLAWAENLSPYHVDGWEKNIECEKEPEVVFFPKINFLGFQNHNEMLYRNGLYGNSSGETEKTIKWSQDILNRFIENKL